MEENNELFIKCDCYAEAIQIQHWKEDQSFYFSFWDYGRSKVSWMPWKKRLTLIWKIIRGKDLYADMVILDYEKSKKVVEFIKKELEDVQSNNSKN